MAKKKEEEVVVEKPAKTSDSTFELKDKSYTHMIVNGILVEVVDGKITVGDKEAVKDFVK